MRATGSDLAGRTAVVTGAGTGIGRALALAAARRGMTLALADVDAAGMAETRAAVEGLGARCLARACDVRDHAALADFAAEVGAAAPPVALLFANAGILRQGSLLDLPLDTLRLLFEVNVFGALATVQAFLPALRRAGKPARIVITGSTGSMTSYAHLAGYCAAKHALWPIAEGLRDDLANAGDPIGVSLLMPGAVSTAIFAEADPTRGRAADAIEPEEAAEIAFAGVAEGRFLILTHPEFVVRARDRFEGAVDELEAAAAIARGPPLRAHA